MSGVVVTASRSTRSIKKARRTGYRFRAASEYARPMIFE
jgi:hypothetical protein